MIRPRFGRDVERLFLGRRRPETGAGAGTGSISCRPGRLSVNTWSHLAQERGCTVSKIRDQGTLDPFDPLCWEERERLPSSATRPQHKQPYRAPNNYEPTQASGGIIHKKTEKKANPISLPIISVTQTNTQANVHKHKPD